MISKYAKIKKHPNKNLWTVYSESGKPMGNYGSLKDAQNRLKQIEFFKHKKINNILEPKYYGKKPDFIDVEIRESSMSIRKELLKLSKNLKILKKAEEAEDIEDMAESLETSETKTFLEKDLKESSNTDTLDDTGDLKDCMMQILFHIKAMELWFHGAHHVTGGTGFSGDHVNLYSKIYEDISENYDEAAEKAIGLTDESVACPLEVSNGMVKVISKYKSPCKNNADEISKIGLNIIHNYLNFLEEMYAKMKKEDLLTLGLDDFIMSMANDYEEIFYLLKQRASKK